VIDGKWKVLGFVIIIGSLAFVLASPAQGNLTYPVVFTVQSGSETVSEVFNQPIQTQVEILSASGACIAKILQLDSAFNPDPIVNLRFSVEAGSSDTIFTISSAVVNFSALTNPEAVASSSLTLTDTDGIRSREPIPLSLAAVEDQRPKLSVQLRGIGSAITPQA